MKRIVVTDKVKSWAKTYAGKVIVELKPVDALESLKAQLTDDDADVTEDNIKMEEPVLTSTESYTLTPEDLEHVTVNLPSDFILTYDKETKSIVIRKKGSEVGIKQVSGLSADTPVSIYSVSGSLQKENATNIDGLSRGMYIINGRKIVVK